jgi:hypothetical protein
MNDLLFSNLDNFITLLIRGYMGSHVRMRKTLESNKLAIEVMVGVGARFNVITWAQHIDQALTAGCFLDTQATCTDDASATCDMPVDI